MKTRLSNARLKKKELSEKTMDMSPRENLKLRRINPKSKTNQKQKSKISSRKHRNKLSPDLLPDQQTGKALIYKVRKCCVKIRKLKSHTVNTSDNIKVAPVIAQKQQDTISDTANCNKKDTMNLCNQDTNTFDRDRKGMFCKEFCSKAKTKIVVGNKSGPALRRHASEDSFRPSPKTEESSKGFQRNITERNRDQAVDENQNKKIRPCLVKIKRTPLAELKKKNNIFNEHEQENKAKSQKCSTTSDLALSRRRLKETRLSAVNGDISREHCYDLDIILSLNATAQNPETNGKSPDKKENQLKPTQRTSPKNLVNKPSIISELLLGDDDINEKPDAVIAPDKKKQPLSNKRKLLEKTCQVRKNVKRYRIKTKSLCRKTSGNENDVYEFLSQSQKSDSDEKRKDPAADIIKKMIEQGKVAVTKNLKGKPVLVNRRKNKKPVLREYQLLREKNKSLKTRELCQPTIDIISEEEEHTHFDENLKNAFENVEVLPIIEEDPKVYSETMSNSKKTVGPSKEATFSTLARSVLMQQTNEKNSYNKSLSGKKRVLQITSREASTPFKRPRLSLLTDTVNLSIIPKLSDKEQNLNNTMDFEHNTSYNLSLIDAEVMSLPQISVKSTPLPRRTGSIQTHQDSRQQSSLSSFSSNDSNAENMPPSPTQDRNEIGNENSLIFNARQTPNPRRALPNRSALQPINIIDVITLPPYKKPLVSEKDKTNPKENGSTQPLFGFEEYLNEGQDEFEEESNHNNSSDLSRKNLRARLKRLKKWRPNVPQYKDAKSSTITKHIFEDKFTKENEHQDIRKMLCSTMVSTPLKETNNTSVNMISDSSDEESVENSPSISKNKNDVDLFGDPETTFDKENLQRTYERPMKKQRKIQPQRQNQQKSKEIENEVESDNEELEKFVTEFNSMLKEAEEYELVVE